MVSATADLGKRLPHLGGPVIFTRRDFSLLFLTQMFTSMSIVVSQESPFRSSFNRTYGTLWRVASLMNLVMSTALPS